MLSNIGLVLQIHLSEFPAVSLLFWSGWVGVVGLNGTKTNLSPARVSLLGLSLAKSEASSIEYEKKGEGGTGVIIGKTILLVYFMFLSM